MHSTATAAGSTGVSVLVSAFTVSTGLPRTDITHSTGGLTLITKRGATGANTPFTAVAQTAEGAWVSGGFVHLGNGVYRVDLPNVFAPGVPWVLFLASGLSDVYFTSAVVELFGSDPRAGSITIGQMRDDSISLLQSVRRSNTTFTVKNSSNADVIMPVLTDPSLDPISEIGEPA